MHRFLRVVVVIVAMATVLPASSAYAQEGELKLSMANGRVTLIARDVPLRVILAEWARVGQTKIVNGDKLAGPPLTLELHDEPEARALATLLRSAAGYVAAPRSAGSNGPSVFDRVMILPTSRPPAVSAAATPAPFSRPTPPPVAPPVDDQDPDPTPGVAAPPPGTQPVPGPAPMQPVAPTQPGTTPMYPGAAAQPAATPMYPGAPPQPGVPPQTGAPAGVQQVPNTAPRPGMLPAPNPTGNPYQQPQQVPPGTRPPGGRGSGGES